MQYGIICFSDFKMHLIDDARWLSGDLIYNFLAFIFYIIVASSEFNFCEEYITDKIMKFISSFLAKLNSMI